MATIKQKKAAKLLVENLKVDDPLTAGEIVENSGYGVSMKKNPQVVLNSDGVQEELKRFGFDEERAKAVVGEILEAGENDSVKLKAAEMIFKTFGTYAPEKSVNLNVNEEISPKMREMAKQLDELRRNTKGSTSGS